MWFHWCYCFLFVFFLALRYCLFLYIFFLVWLFLWLFFIFYQVLFHGCSFSRASFSPECCFFWLFLWPLLPSSFLALCRAPISSDWFFVWHSLRPSSTQLLVCNQCGFCSHWSLAALHFLLSTSIYRLCFSLPSCFLGGSVLVICRVLFSLSASFQLVG